VTTANGILALVSYHCDMFALFFVDAEFAYLLQMLAAKFSGNILINLLGVWAVSYFLVN